MKTLDIILINLVIFLCVAMIFEKWESAGWIFFVLTVSLVLKVNEKP